MKAILCLFASLIWMAPMSEGVDMSDEIKPVNEWSGKTRDEAHIKAAPENGLITDKQTFAELWKKWKPGQPIPEIEFQTDFVLVQQVRSPNSVMVSDFKLKDGDLTFRTAASRMGGPGFGFALLQMSRQGIRTVKQVELPAAVEAQPKKENLTAESPTDDSFKSISVERSGGITGMRQLETVTPDGKIKVESPDETNAKPADRQLTNEQVAALQTFVRETDWSKVPRSAENKGNVSDSMQYVIVVEIGDRKFTFEYDSIPAIKNKAINTLLQRIAGQKSS